MLALPEDSCTERPLFGDAISSCFPLRFQDVSEIREVPDHQEVFADPSHDESLIFELLDFKHDVEDSGSAVWFLRDLAREQDVDESMVLEHTGIVEEVGLRYRDAPVIVTTAVGQMVLRLYKRLTPCYSIFSNVKSSFVVKGISKRRQGGEAQNVVRVYLANLRLKEVGTDVLITAYEPVLINPLSESARTVGAGPAVPTAQSGQLPVAEAFKLAVISFKVHNWNLFSPGT